MKKSLMMRPVMAALMTAALALPAIAEVDAAAQALLPEANKTSGKLLVVTSLAYPPMEYTDAGSEELKGFDIDLAREIAARRRECASVTAPFGNARKALRAAGVLGRLHFPCQPIPQINPSSRTRRRSFRKSKPAPRRSRRRD